MPTSPDPFATDFDRLNWYQRFTLEPVSPAEINDRLSDGGSLVTMDLPSYLSRKAVSDCETGVALYRLVQLWGTPNVLDRTAGAIGVERDRTTWQYLFDVSYDPRPEDGGSVPESFWLSVYDYRTDVSGGLSTFVDDGDGTDPVPEPTADPLPSVQLPPEEFLTGVMGLVLNMVDEAVPATYKELWV